METINYNKIAKILGVSVEDVKKLEKSKKIKKLI
jgi:hypothetical protein